MTNSKYTPGPWIVRPDLSIETGQSGITVAGLVDMPADARLIAAAPAMYEALQWAWQYLRMPNFHPANSYNREQWARDYNKLTDALAQAEGHQHG